MKWSHTHPLSIVQFLIRYLYVLLLPVLKSLIQLPFTPQAFSGLWAWELGAAVLIVLLAVARYLCLTYQVHYRYLMVQSGLIWRKQIRIPYGKISSADVERPVWLAIFGASRLIADTPAKSGGNPDLILLLKKSIAYELAGRLCRSNKRVASSPDFHRGKLPSAHYRTGVLSLTAMAVSSSNAATGILFAVPVINHLGQIVGNELTDRIYSTINAAAQIFSKLLSPIAAVITAFLVAGWLFACCRILFRCARLSVVRRGKSLSIYGGLFFQRRSVLNLQLTGAVDLRQGLTLRLFSLSSAYLICPGYGKQKGERSIFIPSAKPNQMQKRLRELLPELIPHDQSLFSFPAEKSVRPPKNTLHRYLFWPMMITGGSVAAGLLWWIFFPHLRFLLPTIVLVLLLVCVWSLLLCLLNFNKAGICLESGHCRIGCLKRFETHLILLPHRQIERIELTRHPFQREDDLCDVHVMVFGAAGREYVVKNLKRSEVLALLGKESGFPFSQNF